MKTDCFVYYTETKSFINKVRVETLLNLYRLLLKSSANYSNINSNQRKAYFSSLVIKRTHKIIVVLEKLR